MNKTAARSIQAGLILIVLGGFFLYENLVGHVSVFRVIGKYFPVLFLWIGAVKTWRYFRPDPGDTRPRSLSPALLWIALGVFFLLWTTGATSGIFRLLGNWWPLFLIVMGAGKLVDALLPGRVVRLNGGEIVFLLFLIPTGLVCQQIAQLDLSRIPAIPFGNKKFHVRELLKSSVRREMESAITLTDAQSISFSHSNGAVELVPAEAGDKIQVKLDARIYADSDAAAQAAGQALRVTSESTDGQLRIVLPQPEDERTSCEIAVRLAVPPDLPVRIDNSFGDISARELKNPLVLSARNGRITVAGHTGAVQVNDRYSEVSLNEVTGDVQVKGTDAKIHLDKITGLVAAEIKNGSLHLTDINGKLTDLKGQYGSIEGENITGEVKVAASETHVWLQGVRGPASIENAREDVQVTDLQGDLTLKVRSGDIELKQIRGRVQGEATGGSLSLVDGTNGAGLVLDKCQCELDTVDGPVQIVNSTDPIILRAVTGAVDVKNRNANISIHGLPADPKIKVAAATERGDITFFLPAFPEKRLFRLTSTGGRIRSDLGGEAPKPAAEGGLLVWQNFAGDPKQATLTGTAVYGDIHFQPEEKPQAEEEN